MLQNLPKTCFCLKNIWYSNGSQRFVYPKMSQRKLLTKIDEDSQMKKSFNNLKRISLEFEDVLILLTLPDLVIVNITQKMLR